MANCALTKTRNDLKPPETNRNLLKPPETIWNYPETTWNYLKPPETRHIIVFLLKISYSQVDFVLILCPKVFFRQIWSQKLKFFKFTKIWHRGTLQYPHFKFNVYFSKKIYYSHFLGEIWSQNLKFFKLTEIRYRSTFLYTYYDFKVYFSKIFVTHTFWTNLVP